MYGSFCSLIVFFFFHHIIAYTLSTLNWGVLEENSLTKKDIM